MLCGDAEDCVDELARGYGIGLPDPPDLTLADRIHRFETVNRSPCSVRRTEAEARCDPLLDKAMVPLDDVVQIRRGPAITTATEFNGLLQLGDCAGIRRMAIPVDDTRRRRPARQRETQEQPR